MTEDQLLVRLDVRGMALPEEVDLTSLGFGLHHLRPVLEHLRAPSVLPAAQAIHRPVLAPGGYRCRQSVPGGLAFQKPYPLSPSAIR